MNYRIIIAGGRDFNNYELLKKTLNEYFERTLNVKATELPWKIEQESLRIEIISGGAKGADSLGEKYAEEYGIPVVRYPADWKKYGRAAGPKRNEEMARAAAADGFSGVLFAFWDGTSPGTANMIKTAEKFKLDVNVILY
ncbi:MAG: DUF2493 domain-containing protein [Ruminococcaceae bacterium]|nr:DUF2493 domain-containing protein [Oscillospiraceae bacterium]